MLKLGLCLSEAELLSLSADGHLYNKSLGILANLDIEVGSFNVEQLASFMSRT